MPERFVSAGAASLVCRRSDVLHPGRYGSRQTWYEARQDRCSGKRSARRAVARADSRARRDHPAEPRKPRPGRLASAPAPSRPAVADPRLAAELARRGFQANSFRFTPAPTSINRSQSIRVAIRARAATPAGALRRAADASATPVTAITPTVYNLGASIGWKRFALSGDVDSVKGGTIPGGREAAEVGVSYSGNRFTARAEAGVAQRRSGDSADHRRRRELYGRSRRLLPHRPQPRCDRRRPLQDPARPARGPGRPAPRQPGRLRRHRLPLLEQARRAPGVDSRPAISVMRPSRARASSRVHAAERDDRNPRLRRRSGRIAQARAPGPPGCERVGKAGERKTRLRA